MLERSEFYVGLLGNVAGGIMMVIPELVPQWVGWVFIVPSTLILLFSLRNDYSHIFKIFVKNEVVKVAEFCISPDQKRWIREKSSGVKFAELKDDLSWLVQFDHPVHASSMTARTPHKDAGTHIFEKMPRQARIMVLGTKPLEDILSRTPTIVVFECADKS